MIPPVGNPDEAISGESASEEPPDNHRSHRGVEGVRQAIIGGVADRPVIFCPGGGRRPPPPPPGGRPRPGGATRRRPPPTARPPKGPPPPPPPRRPPRAP